MKLVECVPNFSEGRDRAVIDAIARAIESVDGVRLLDVDPGVATNRTVVTFVGTPAAAAEAAFRAIRTAGERIDMRQHRGEHARLGATDVCPFVPLGDATMEDCVALARELGARVGRELEIPIYLYEAAALHPERRNLATIRAGEYEGLEAKLRDRAWKPDFGPARFDAARGATVIGARPFLVAYNINLNTRDKRLANDIALDLRESGRAARDASGAIVRDAAGKPVLRPGRFPHLKAVGWMIEEYGRAQISINFTNTDVTPVHVVFDAACAEAERRGLRVTGSELVGLVPRGVMLAAGRHYLRKQGKSAGAPEAELIHVAVLSLGLGELKPFIASERIVEDRVRGTAGMRLQSLSLGDFADELSTDSPAPGGGSVAALVGALGAALAAMVANLSHRPGSSSEIEELAIAAQSIKSELLAAVDRDAAAFDAVLAARRLPKATGAAASTRDAAIRAALREACGVPLGVAQAAARAAEAARAAARVGIAAAQSDAGVAALCAATAAEGAYYNVLINLAELTDPADAEFVRTTRDAGQTACDQAQAAAETVRTTVRGGLAPAPAP